MEELNYFKIIGRKGGKATLKKYGRDKLLKWARRGTKASPATKKGGGNKSPIDTKRVGANV